jgi:conjugal transfer ATP-binding protein TraC
MTAFNAVNIAPLQGEWKGMRTPSLLLPGRRGQLAIWNPFDNPEGNYNVAIAAASGKGKSMFTQEYIVCLLGSGGRVWVIDVGRSYEKTCRMLGGSFLEFTPESKLCVNPFTTIRDFDASLVMLKPLLAAMARPTSKASDEELSYIEKALKSAWNEAGNKATITTVANWLSQQQNPICVNLGHLLYTYTKEGMYGCYFEGECNINLDNNLVVLELQELKAKRDLQKIMLLVLMYQIAESMYMGNRSQVKSCIIDEAWDLLGGDNDGAASFIETGYRTARRYNANFVTITQSINDYFKNATSIAAFENSDNNVILGQKEEAIDQLRQSGRLSMDDYTEKLFKSLRKTDDYSECIIKMPFGMSVHRIIFDPYSRILYSSKGEEFEAVNALQAQGLSLSDAIDRVARRFHAA